MSRKNELKRINIAEIKDPSFLATLNYKELDAFSHDMREYIIDCVSKNGGHLASNLGVVESTIALCRVFDFSKDKIVFDVGHQSYTYKVLTGRSLERLRNPDGVSGFQKRDESPYDHFEAGHSSTSISVCNGMAIARDAKNEKYDIISFIGDASVFNGLALEALNNLGQSDHKVIIILNDNDMSITKPVGGFSNSLRRLSNSTLYRRSKHAYQRALKKTRFGRWLLRRTSAVKNWFKRHFMSLNIFDFLGFSYYGPVDGHNIKALEKAFKKAKNLDKSVVVHIKTLKGKGYSYSENDDSGSWHGVGPFNKETGEMLKNEYTWSDLYAASLDGFMKRHDDAYLVVPATGTGSKLNHIFKEYKGRCFDVGIAEEHALTFSGGLANSGLHPVISIYSTFLQRAYDELSHDLARMNLSATILIDRAGLVGKDGDTHQGIYDEQFLLGIPNVVVSMAANAEEAEMLLEESYKKHGVFCIRYPRESLDEPSKIEKCYLAFGKWKQETNGTKQAIISMGPVIGQLKEYIIKNNIDATLFNAIYQKPMDEEALKGLLNYKRVIIYDAYSVEAGFASICAARLAELGYKGETIIKAIPDVYVKHASIEQQKQDLGVSLSDIEKLL